MFRRFQYSMMQFMAGRYGTDSLQKVLLWTYCILVIINALLGSLLFALAELALIGWFLFRMLSRNIPARMQENEWYLNHTAGLRRWGRRQKNRFRDRKTHVYRTCPHCKATVRLPKTKRGRHACDCPRCRREFQVKI